MGEFWWEATGEWTYLLVLIGYWLVLMGGAWLDERLSHRKSRPNKTMKGV